MESSCSQQQQQSGLQQQSGQQGQYSQQGQQSQLHQDKTKPNIGLDDNARQQGAQFLQTLLADEYKLMTKAKLYKIMLGTKPPSA